MNTINTDEEFLAEILLRLENSNITYLEARQSLLAYCKERERLARVEEVNGLGGTTTHPRWCRKKGEQYIECLQCLKDARIEELEKDK